MVALACMAGAGSRLTVADAEFENQADVMSDFFDRTLELSASGVGVASTAMAPGGWSAVKCENGGNPQSGEGYFSIVDAPEGFVGTLPVPESRCLRMHSVPVELEDGFPNWQTDFYLQGHNALGSGNIPANHWGQVWLYSNHTVNEPSRLNNLRNKFIYGNASASLGEEGSLMMFAGNEAFQTLWNAGWVVDDDGDFFIGCRPWYNSATDEGANYPPFGGSITDRLSANLTPKFVKQNRWTLFRWHLDVSGATGSFNYWLRDLIDDEDLVHVARWEHGVFPETFEFNTNAVDRAGCTHFRMPTTCNSPIPSDPPNDLDQWWLYMQGFQIATAENLLRDYS
jgi:hypothetical protein